MPRPKRRYTRTPRRRMQWTHVITDPANIAAAGQASVDILQNARSVADDSIARGNTIKRVLGDIYIWPGDASNITEGTIGITRTEADAEAASATADPGTDTLARWLYWKRILTGTQATGELSTGEATRFELDLKMNLRLNNRADALNVIIDNDDGTHTMLFALGLRILIAK